MSRTVRPKIGGEVFFREIAELKNFRTIGISQRKIQVITDFSQGTMFHCAELTPANFKNFKCTINATFAQCVVAFSHDF
jgi:hypothetical protein